MKKPYMDYRHDRPLLERLRDHHNLNTPHANAMQEAADEIERLQLELKNKEMTHGKRLKNS